MCIPLENQPSHYSANNGQALRSRLASLSDTELHRLLTMVTLMAGADEALADIRMGLATVEITFYFIDTPAPSRVVTTPAELLPILQQLVSDAQSGRSIRLLVD